MKVKRKIKYTVELSQQDADRVVDALGRALRGLSALERAEYGVYSKLVSDGVIDRLLGLKTMIVNQIPDEA
ncbi:MAG TPA: hypothetical protein VGG75_13715 [Trebonia sp.]